MVTHHQEQLKVALTDTEQLEIARGQAQKMADLDDLNRQLDRAKADYKSAITRVETEIADAARKLRDRWELRMVSCMTALDCPDNGVASIFREDTGELVRSRPMVQSELQRDLPLAEGQPETSQIEVKVETPEEAPAGEAQAQAEAETQAEAEPEQEAAAETVERLEVELLFREIAAAAHDHLAQLYADRFLPALAPWKTSLRRLVKTGATLYEAAQSGLATVERGNNPDAHLWVKAAFVALLEKEKGDAKA